MRALGFGLSLLASTAYAASLGSLGEVFMIEEESLMTVIESKIRQGELEVIQAEWVKKVEQEINHPKSLQLKRARQSTHHHYRPSVVLQQEVRDAEGHLLFPKGFKVNALDAMPAYTPHWLFINADDEAQLRWVKYQLIQLPHAKVILTGGVISNTAHQLQRPVYFDQGGRITQKLGITSVPARVSRDKNRLLVEEIAIREDFDAN